MFLDLINVKISKELMFFNFKNDRLQEKVGRQVQEKQDR